MPGNPGRQRARGPIVPPHPFQQHKTGGNRSPRDCFLPPSTPPTATSMGQHPSKVHKSPSATKSVSSLKRVSRLFQPGLKNQHASGSNGSSPQQSKAEDATSNAPRDDPEAEGRPAGGTDDQV
jgi:hypothetical protein